MIDEKEFKKFILEYFNKMKRENPPRQVIVLEFEDCHPTRLLANCGSYTFPLMLLEIASFCAANGIDKEDAIASLEEAFDLVEEIGCFGVDDSDEFVSSGRFEA